SAAVIPGASRPERIAEDHAALAAVIPSDFWREMRELRLVAPNAPLPIDRERSHGGKGRGSCGRTGGGELPTKVPQPLGQELYAAVQSPLHRSGGNAEHRRGLGFRESLDVHQVERLTFIIRQIADGFEDEPGGRGEVGVAAGRSGNDPGAQFYG